MDLNSLLLINLRLIIVKMLPYGFWGQWSSFHKDRFFLWWLIMQEENDMCISLCNICFVCFGRSQNDAAKYYDGYGKLRSWAYNSLDSYRVNNSFLVVYFHVILLFTFSYRRQYFFHSSWITVQHELLCVLYPVFIHCFMDLVAQGHMQEGTLFTK